VGGDEAELLTLLRFRDNETLDNTLSGANDFTGAVSVSTANGIDYNPGSDTDVDLITVGVTGAPRVWWDESEDSFIFTKGIQVPSYERHIQIPAFLSGTVANQPTAVTVGTAAGLQFSSALDKSVGIQWEVPDDWAGDDAYLEIDWFPDSGAISGTDTLKWDVSYRAIAEGETITNGTQVDLSDTDSTDYAQYETKHTRFTLDFDHANQPMTKQDHMYFTITRDTAVANDFAGTVVVTAFEIIYNSISLPTSN